MFEKEAFGLKYLRDADCLRVPKVIFYEDNFLVLEYLESGPENFRTFGTSLAELHTQPVEYFGFEHDNYLGTLRQANSRVETWGEFFVANRVHYQLSLAHCTWASEELLQLAKRNSDKMVSILNRHEPVPCLIHGDLWSGNLMFTNNGPALIDPAAYYGHGEMDLAYLQYFGNPPVEFWRAYHKIIPALPGLQDRIKILSLYIELTHANMFAGHYCSQVERTLRQINSL